MKRFKRQSQTAEDTVTIWKGRNGKGLKTKISSYSS